MAARSSETPLSTEKIQAGTLTGVPFDDYQRWANSADIFERAAAYLRDTVTLTGDGEPERVMAVRGKYGFLRSQRSAHQRS